jgi:CRISPR-associated autoregulator DevR family
MLNPPTLTVYDLSINVLVSWQAHSLSNAGTHGSNKVMSRCQMLADGTVTDACSGSIAKHHHAVLLAEYLAASGIALCPACLQRDGRRVAALIERPEYKNVSVQQILQGCGLCDAHGFLVTAKNASSQQGTEARERNAKHSLVEFSFALGLPGRSHETMHLFTRIGDSKEEGQMLMKKPARSGDYALEVRYTSVGIGVDTDKWQVAIVDEQERRDRHRAILSALRDTLLSPDGAMTATMLPHLTGLQGAIVVLRAVGRAPMYSALKEDFIARLVAMRRDSCLIYPFETVDEFHVIMEDLIATTAPCLPPIPAASLLAARTVRLSPLHLDRLQCVWP